MSLAVATAHESCVTCHTTHVSAAVADALVASEEQLAATDPRAMSD